MKKITLAIAAIIMGFVMASCGGGSEKAKESMIKDADEYFTKAEQTLAQIDNTEDFLMFVESMKDRSDLLESMKKKYDNKITDEDLDAACDVIYERASVYNKVEAEKAKEFMGPELDIIENYVNELYAQFQAGNELDKETVKNFDDAYVNFLKKYKDYDNVLPELQKRRDAIWGKMDEMNEVLIAKLKEIYPEQ